MKFSLVFLYTFLCFQLLAQTKPTKEGKYPTRIFTASEYEAGNNVLCFIQDRNGILYSGNTQGISIYNGANWELIELPNKSEVLWLSVNNEDTVFVAANDEFGYIAKKNGSQTYQSLTHLLPDSIHGFGSIWEVESTSYGTYFRTSTYLFWYHNSKLEVLSMKDYSGGFFDVVFSVDDTLHLRIRQLGLGRMIGDRFELLPGGKFFEDIKTNAILSLDENVLVATRSEGLFIVDSTGIREFDNDIQQLLKQARIYHATTYHNSIAIATLTKGVFILDKEGKLIEHINEQEYNINETTNYVYLDTQDALWIGTLNGIIRIDFQDRFRVFDSIKGSNVVVLDFLKYKGIFYFATSTGLYYSNTNSFKNAKKVKGIYNPCYAISIIDGHIFIDVNSGIFKIDENFKAIKQGDNISGFVEKTQVKNCYFIGGQEGLTLATYDGQKFKVKKVLNVGKNIESLYEFAPNQLWLFPKNNGISYYNLNSDSLINYPQFGHSKAINVNNKPVFLTAKGVYEYDEYGFTPSSFFYSYVDSSQYNVVDIKTDSEENVLILYADPSKKIYGKWLEKKNDQNYQSYSLPSINISISDYTSTYLDRNGELWLAGHNQILKVDMKKSPPESSEFKVKINALYADGEKLQMNKDNIRIPFKSNTIQFDYAAIYYNSYGTNEYQFQLIGVDSEWSEWSESNSIEFTYLREGDYTFKVRSKNPNDVTSNVASYSFTILSPWYRSKVAIIIYLAVIILIIFIVSRIRSVQLKKENKLLEKLVDERTEEVASKNQKLEEVNLLKSTFFANISHELRTPLTLISGQLENIKREKQASRINELIDSSLRNASQLGSMIEDLLDLSKLELGRNIIDPRPTKLNKTLKRITESFQSLAESKDIDLKYSDTSKDEIYVNLDTRQFEKVINNLIYNALKFTSDKGEIGVRLKQQDTNIIIEIYDTGSGIEVDELPYIFDRFYQAKNQVAKETGSGLGLAISKEIVELHGGKIKAESVLDKGTTLIISLPQLLGEFETEEVDIEDEKQLSIDELLEQHILKGSLDKPQVLVVEDNEEMQYYLKSILSPHFKVAQAINGQEALNWLKTNSTDLIISDVMMPVMTGLELLQELKKSLTYQHIPVIILTAKASQEDRIEGLQFGVDDYITKPFNIDELIIRAINLITNLNARISLAKEMPDEETENQLTVSKEDEKMIKTAEQYIESRISESSLSVNDVASSVAMSERQFYRKIGKLTGMTPSNFIMEIRLHYAHKLLIGGNIIKLSQVASEIGINSPSYFSKLFYERFGKKASKYLKK